MRREWIEIAVRRYGSKLTASPSMRREWIEIMCGFGIHIEKRRLPPCGGSGLKFTRAARLSAYSQSPSMRREWIEMYRLQTAADPTLVSLHAEGVD